MSEDDKIKPNGKALLKEALPGKKHGYVLALRESHTNGDHFTYLKDHLNELKNQHNLGTISHEFPPYLMVLNWSYRDAAPGLEKEKARSMLSEAYTNVFRDYPESALATCTMVTAALDKGIDVIYIDSRHRLQDIPKLHNREFTGIQENGITRRPTATEKNEQRIWDDTQYHIYQNIVEICKSHPEYQKKLDAIETTVQSLQQKQIPLDTISATLATQLADPHKNMITISGSKHLAGKYTEDSQGIFDDALQQAHLPDGSRWHVTDGWMMASAMLPQQLAKKFVPHAKDTADQMDFLWLTDTDHVVTRAPSVASSRIASPSSPLKAAMKSLDICADAAPVKSVYPLPEQLDPSALPGLQQVMQDLHTAFTSSHATNAPARPSAIPQRIR